MVEKEEKETKSKEFTVVEVPTGTETRIQTPDGRILDAADIEVEKLNLLWTIKKSVG